MSLPCTRTVCKRAEPQLRGRPRPSAPSPPLTLAARSAVRRRAGVAVAAAGRPPPSPNIPSPTPRPQGAAATPWLHRAVLAVGSGWDGVRAAPAELTLIFVASLFAT